MSEQIKRSVVLRILLAELGGTFALVLVGLSAIAIFMGEATVAGAIPSHFIRLCAVLLCFGLVIAAVASSPLSRISGTHINPALSLALAVKGSTRWAHLPLYLAGQLAGALLAALAVRLLLPVSSQATLLGATLPGPGYGPLAAFGAEFAGTALLMHIVLWCGLDEGRARLAPLLAGGFVAVYGTALAPVSGSSFNPARSLAPALLAGIHEHQWIYLAAPSLGALTSVILWRLAANRNRSAGASRSARASR